MKKRVVNIVNFVRANSVNHTTALAHPEKKLKAFETVEKQIECNKEYNIPNTFLLQYDVIWQKNYRELFLRERDENMEMGVWLEMCRSLVEKVGIDWRGRGGYDYDWHVNSGYLEGYTPSEREKIIDEVFRSFKEVYGAYPKVAGGWVLDSHSIKYMTDKYGMKAFCVCREQFAVDAYTLWGGYFSGGYYPSRYNMLCPAQSIENQINTPVFRMLGIDPIYGYDIDKYAGNIYVKGTPTMEPTWIYGQNDKIMDWYFKEYYTNPCLSHSHATTGQENTFEWGTFGNGYVMQVGKLAKLQKEGAVAFEKLGDTGEAYKKAFDLTPPAALSALSDWADSGHQSVWYNCRNYRANLFLHEKRLSIRDIHKFDELYRDRYLSEKTDKWNAIYDNLPVISSRFWEKDGEENGLFFEKPVKSLSLSEQDERNLIVYAEFSDNTKGRIMFDEKEISFENCAPLIYKTGTLDEQTKLSVSDKTLQFTHRGFPYSVKLECELMKTESGYQLCESEGKIKVIMRV